MTKEEAKLVADKIVTTIGGWYEDKETKQQLTVTKVVVSEQDNGDFLPLVYGYIPKGNGYYICDGTKFPNAVLAITQPK